MRLEKGIGVVGTVDAKLEGHISTFAEHIHLLKDRNTSNEELLNLSVSDFGAALKAEMKQAEGRLRDGHVKYQHVSSKGALRPPLRRWKRTPSFCMS